MKGCLYMFEGLIPLSMCLRGFECVSRGVCVFVCMCVCACVCVLNCVFDGVCG